MSELTDAIAEHWTSREVDEDGDHLVCECGKSYSNPRLWAAHVELNVTDQHLRGVRKAKIIADMQELVHARFDDGGSVLEYILLTNPDLKRRLQQTFEGIINR
jgi:hypothetical protein